MATSIIMPKAGMAMETGTVIEWKVAVGDRIEVGDEILEIETDKVAMPVEAETSGYLLAILAQPGDVVPVTETIGWIGEQGEQAPEGDGSATGSSSGGVADAGGSEGASAAGAASDRQADTAGGAVVGRSAAGGQSAQAGAQTANGRVKATPAARRRAAELGVDIQSLRPSGPDGDVRIRDVEQAAAGGGSSSRVSPLARQEAQRAGVSLEGIEGTGPGGRIRRRDVVEQAAGTAAATGLPPSRTPVSASAEALRTPLTGMRKVIAERMTESHLTMPPVTLNAAPAVDALLALRAQLNAGAEAAGRRKISINDLILKATAAAVRQCPWVNVSLDGSEIVQHPEINLGMAVAIEQGLVVPVIHGADRMPLGAIADRARELGRRARERSLEIADLEGGTFTVSNLGMYGITTFTPIINPPQAAILGVGTVRTELALDASGAVHERSRMDLSLTMDHRLIDGAQGAIFVKALVDLMENPAQILL